MNADVLKNGIDELVDKTKSQAEEIDKLKEDLGDADEEIGNLKMEILTLEREPLPSVLADGVVFGDVYVAERCMRCDGKGFRQGAECEQCHKSGLSLKPITLQVAA